MKIPDSILRFDVDRVKRKHREALLEAMRTLQDELLINQALFEEDNTAKCELLEEWADKVERFLELER